MFSLQIHFLSEKLHEAKEDFEKCISLNDGFIPARIQLAYCIYKSAALQQSPILAQGAMDMLQKTVEKYPESADAHSLFAQVCVTQGSILSRMGLSFKCNKSRIKVAQW